MVDFRKIVRDEDSLGQILSNSTTSFLNDSFQNCLYFIVRYFNKTPSRKFRFFCRSCFSNFVVTRTKQVLSHFSSLPFLSTVVTLTPGRGHPGTSSSTHIIQN